MANRLQKVQSQAKRREHRVRTKLHGTATRPRLHVAVSNRHISAQLIDDDAGVTLVAVTTVGKKQDAQPMTEKATWVGAEIAKKAKTQKLSAVIFDRGAKQYHGRVKALAEAARENGLEF